MSVALYRLAGVGLVCALAAPASAQLLARKDLSAAMAVTIAQTTIATCTANGYSVSVTVVGRNGEVLLQVRGDGTGPHTMENSLKKAYHVAHFPYPVRRDGRAAEEESADGRDSISPASPPGVARCRSRSARTSIGAVGASGAPGGEKDEACVQAGIDKVADQLK